MIEIVQDRRSGERAAGNLFDGERGAITPRENQKEIYGESRMTQTQLVRSLAESCEVNNKAARAFLDGLASMAIAEVKKNGVFVLPGIGRLVRVDRKARMGRNPATGEASRSRPRRS